MRFWFIVLMLVLKIGIAAEEHLVIAHPGINRGFFSVMDHVVGNIFLYINTPEISQKYSGFSVNFGSEGFYYEPNKGSNWFCYYFEEIVEGSSEGAPVFLKKTLCGKRPGFAEFRLTREQYGEILEQYVHIKQPIMNELNEYCETHFTQHFVVGVHYRGTDKINEAPRVEYETVYENVIQALQGVEENFRIFVATDESAFVTFMQERFPDQVLFLEDVDRSDGEKPIHKCAERPYESGLYALMDAYLLSRCDLLLRTSSNLSRCSTCFNVDLPVIELSKRGRGNNP